MMPLIKPEKDKELEKIKLSIDSSTLKEIKDYCKWASVENIETFFEQASEFVLKKDSEWKKYKKGKR